MIKYVILIILAGFLYSCTPSVEVIHFGNDECNYCKMSIVDQRYGAEVLTTKGKVFKYDAIECMINALCQNDNNGALNFHSAYVIDFSSPGTLVEAKKSFYLISEKLPSPMGAYLTAFSDSIGAISAQQKYTGEIYNWKNVILEVLDKKTCKHEF